jgi:hypothetical protein
MTSRMIGTRVSIQVSRLARDGDWYTFDLRHLNLAPAILSAWPSRLVLRPSLSWRVRDTGLIREHTLVATLGGTWRALFGH